MLCTLTAPTSECGLQKKYMLPYVEESLYICFYFFNTFQTAEKDIAATRVAV